MNTHDEIRAAIDDYRNSRNGFEKAASWESKISRALSPDEQHSHVDKEEEL
jgi:hypothetical protein